MSDDVVATPAAAGGQPDAAPQKRPDHATKLALQRTMLASDRTLMAWVRTAMSLISFGLTIQKVFQYLESSHLEAEQSLLTPRGLSLVMIGLGVVSLFFATLEYRSQMALMRETYSEYGPFHNSLASKVAALISVGGMLAFLLVLLRL